MSGQAGQSTRLLPRGWSHLAAQFALWMGFYALYQVARGLADRGVGEAFANGGLVIDAQKQLGLLFEPALQRVVESSRVLIEVTSLTYWLSQFAVVGIALLWVYFRHHEHFSGLRNWLIAANLVGLIGYVVMPTAPPRMFPEWGFSDTLAQFSAISHQSLGFLANPFAAMPSLHSMDAFIVSAVMSGLVRHRIARFLWLAWAPWVWFSVVGTGNHFWLDCAAGVAIALVCDAVLMRERRRAGGFDPVRA